MINFLFDVDDTLYDQLIPFENAYRAVFNKYNLDCSIELLFVRSRYYSDQVFELVNEGKMDKREMQIYRISKAFESLGIDISREEACLFQAYYEKNQQQIVVHSEMKRLLDVAHSLGIKLGIITNGPAEHQARKVKQLALRNWMSEKHIFISGKLGISKPDSKIFKHVEDFMGLLSKETYYFGDSFNNDVIGAKKSGWKAVWVNRRKQSIPSHTQYSPDYIIDDTHSPMAVMREILAQHNSHHKFTIFKSTL